MMLECVAMSCYKAQLIIVKERPVSTDNDLHTVITELKESLPPVEGVLSAGDVIN